MKKITPEYPVDASFHDAETEVSFEKAIKFTSESNSHNIFITGHNLDAIENAFVRAIYQGKRRTMALYFYHIGDNYPMDDLNEAQISDFLSKYRLSKIKQQLDPDIIFFMDSYQIKKNVNVGLKKIDAKNFILVDEKGKPIQKTKAEKIASIAKEILESKPK
jgi:hypothetical protein